ncbi:MAG TPA: hypothetical protein PLX15_01440 [Candidatus Woesearchaeota archaeon]|nr:hypothetical protein [Candidatus Woesearchaeota archaeon]
MKLKKIMIIGVIILSFMIVILGFLFYIEQSKINKRLNPLELEIMTKEQIIQMVYLRQEKTSSPMYYFIPIFSFFGLGIGATLYYVLSSNIEKKDKLIKHNSDVILKLLNNDERRVIKKIVENNGKVQQLEITYMQGFSKVKAHRIVESLVNKDIVTKEALGKIRLIRLDKELYDILRKN